MNLCINFFFDKMIDSSLALPLCSYLKHNIHSVLQGSALILYTIKLISG